MNGSLSESAVWRKSLRPDKHLRIALGPDEILEEG